MYYNTLLSICKTLFFRTKKFNYLNGKLENILLWENPNIKAEFPAQTITLFDDLTNYRYFEIYFTLSATTPYIENGYSKFVVNNKFTRFDIMSNNANLDGLYYRTITRDLSTPNKISISIAYLGNNLSGNLQHADTFIPYRIYGIK